MYGKDTSLLHPFWQMFPVLKAVHSQVLSQTLQENLCDDTVPNEWKRHQLALTVAENMLYTPILAKASSLKTVHSQVLSQT